MGKGRLTLTIPTPICLKDISQAEKKSDPIFCLAQQASWSSLAILDLTSYLDIGIGCGLVSAGMYVHCRHMRGVHTVAHVPSYLSS